MKILTEKSHNGSTIHGEAIMLSKYGDVLDVIDSKYHPNPGPREEGYPEIERCIDWCYIHELDDIIKWCDEWIKIRVAQEMYEDPSISSDELVANIMFTDLYTPCEEVVTKIMMNRQYFTTNSSDIPKIANEDIGIASDKIAIYINEKFTRVRAGGKLNPEGTDSIYFRISSHGYDWHRTIVDFLWGTFESIDKMPSRIWIGHDAENNPPEITLFDGSPSDLLEKEDSKVFENLRSNDLINKDRDMERLNAKYYKLLSDIKEYKSYK